jgi:hypothetical protein
MEFLWFSSNPPSQCTDSAFIRQLWFPSRPSPYHHCHQSFHQPLRDTDTLQSTLLLHKTPATPPATQRHWHATEHTPAQATSHATSHSETLTRHKAHTFFTSHQLLLSTFTTFYGTHKFTTMFARAQHLYPPWASSVHSTRSHPTSLTSTVVISCHLRLDF